MLIQKFLGWTEGVNAEARADAAGALAMAYLYGELDSVDTGEALRTLTLLLDDPSPLVRRVLAESFATAVDAPRHILAVLVGDRSDIAAIVLGRSPVLSDAELIDAVAIGDSVSQAAVASRASVSAALAGAIAEVGGIEALLAVSRNTGADLTDFAVGRMLDRFGADGALRETLGRRHDISPEMRHAIVVATARTLGDFALTCGWMTPQRVERMLCEAQDRATVAIATAEVSADVEHEHFASYLASGGYLTPALILRGLLSGNFDMVEAVICELSGRPAKRVGAILRNPDGLGFTALYKATGLPFELMPAFRSAFRVVAARWSEEAQASAGLDYRMIDEVIRVYEAGVSGDATRITALLRRFEAEAARDHARGGFRHRVASDRDALRLRGRQEPSFALEQPDRVAA